MINSASIPVLTVTQLNRYVKLKLDDDEHLQELYLRGEISNFTNHYRSGHLYFSLKDSEATIKAVMFSSAASRLRFEVADGMQVITRGRVSLYDKTGQYQFYVEDLQPDGIGALSLAYEQLKGKLEKEGLFDFAYKKSIPKYPLKVAVITSPTGAAVRDILQISARRWPLAEIVMCPVLVQGDQAAAQLSKAVEAVNRKKAADVIIIGRGGGSLEDLFAFNEEIVARAVFTSEIPVISAVGHETDFTICDFVSDLRAPTPSAAAELALPDAQNERDTLLDSFYYLKKLVSDKLTSCKTELRNVTDLRFMKKPLEIINSRKYETDMLSKKFENYATLKISAENEKLSYLAGKLDAISPLKVLARGYTVAQKNGKTIKSVCELKEEENFTLRFTDGKITCQVKERQA